MTVNFNQKIDETYFVPYSVKKIKVFFPWLGSKEYTNPDPWYRER